MSKLISAAMNYIGQREVPGPGVNAWIKDMWLGLPGGKWFWSEYGQDDSKLPWCGAFVARVCKDAGCDFPKRYSSALAWAEWGEFRNMPEQGCVAVLTRDGGGHVGIVTGISPDGMSVRLLGGNQSDAVSESWFQVRRVKAWRAPAGEALAKVSVAQVGQFSKSEA
jgi:uncharacterized protein (TIGR02594 family)